ncbi:neuregulin 2b [Plakobranchus ocellatus]|uniref:Neuregulin 2b n=1 Tax=Plakobranchus ocellatus TaxID=259542 RepID=A0AAV4BCY3_9GAST|nr:neuregulin 2b [Plakobranchus ocellatus]
MAPRQATKAAYGAVDLWLLVVVCLQFLAVVADECGTRFVDPKSSTVRAQVVFQGSVSSMGPASGDSQIRSANVTIDKIFKGMDVLKRIGVDANGSVMVDWFGQDENRDECVASMSVTKSDEEHIFFTRPSYQRVLQMTALPLSFAQSVKQAVEESLCDTCIQPPEITRVMCQQCARPPVIRKLNARKVKMGQKARLGCYGSGKPHPKFHWLKAGVPLTPGSAGVTIRSTKTSSVLIIRRTTSAHRGQYICRIENDIGRSEKAVDLEIAQRSAAAKPKYNVRNAPDKQECSRINVCLNGGTCYYSPSLDLSFCKCTDGYEGVKCQNEVSAPMRGRVTAGKGMTTNPGVTSEEVTHQSEILQQGTSGAPQTTSRLPQSASDSNGSLGGADTRIAAISAKRDMENDKEFMPTPGRTQSEHSAGSSKHSTETSGNHPASRRHFSNVDEEAQKIILSRLNNNQLQSSECNFEGRCLNGGTCRRVHELDVEICVCREQYTGQRCEQISEKLPLQPKLKYNIRSEKPSPQPKLKYNISNAPDRYVCSVYKCFNGGTCFFSPSLDLSVCECPDGFEGVRCQNVDSTSKTFVSTVTTATQDIRKGQINSNEKEILTVNQKRNMTSQKRTDYFDETTPKSLLVVSTIPTNITNTGQRSGDTATVATTLATPTNNIDSTESTSRKATSSQKSNRRKNKGSSRSRNNSAVGSDNSYIDDESLKLILVRLRKSRLKAGKCRSKDYCLNGGKCRYVHKLAIQVCLCRHGYAGRRCESATQA